MSPSSRQGSRPGSRRSSTEIPEGHRLKRTPSKASSMFSIPWRKSPAPKDDDGDLYKIVIYDPLDKNLYMDSKKVLEKLSPYVRVPIKGTETRVFVSIQDFPIATVDLAKLGRGAKDQRRKGKMQHIYVLGEPPMGLDPVAEENEGDASGG